VISRTHRIVKYYYLRFNLEHLTSSGKGVELCEMGRIEQGMRMEGGNAGRVVCKDISLSQSRYVTYGVIESFQKHEH